MSSPCSSRTDRRPFLSSILQSRLQHTSRVLSFLQAHHDTLQCQKIMDKAANTRFYRQLLDDLSREGALASVVKRINFSINVACSLYIRLMFDERKQAANDGDEIAFAPKNGGQFGVDDYSLSGSRGRGTLNGKLQFVRLRPPPPPPSPSKCDRIGSAHLTS